MLAASSLVEHQHTPGPTTINTGTLQLPAPGVPVPVASYSFDGYTPGVLNNGAVITNTGSGGSPMNVP